MHCEGDADGATQAWEEAEAILHSLGARSVTYG